MAPTATSTISPLDNPDFELVSDAEPAFLLEDASVVLVVVSAVRVTNTVDGGIVFVSSGFGALTLKD